ncbi:MAG: hypothetical protein ABI663_05390 [Chryseolinea sp.]
MNLIQTTQELQGRSRDKYDSLSSNFKSIPMSKGAVFIFANHQIKP